MFHKFTLAVVCFHVLLVRANAFNFSDLNTFFLDSDLTNLPEIVSVPIDNLCLSYYKDLTLTSAQFIECAVNYSRPFHLCQNCLKSYLEMRDVRNLIINVSLFLIADSQLNNTKF